MLHSMTAFGRGEAGADGYRFTIELRTLNHRFCDVRIKLPRKYSDFEEDIKKTSEFVQSEFGRVDFLLNSSAILHPSGKFGL